MFYVGDFTKRVEAADIIPLDYSSQTENLPFNTICSKWEHVFEWDQRCVKASTLEQ